MTYAYYPGCSLHSTGSEYDVSFRAVCDGLGVKMRELEGWVCCGTSPAHCTSRLLAYTLPFQNLCLAEKMGMSEVVAPCAACFARLKGAIHAADANPELEARIQEILERPLPKSIRVLSPLEIFSNGIDIAGAVTQKLPDLKVACYYGCLLTRPPEIMEFDDCEYPMSMDLILRSMNIITVDWSYKTDCCGGALALTETDVVLKLTRDILEEAKEVGANAVAVACPLCHANLDTRQGEIEQKYGRKYDIPIFYFTQLMGAAMGIAPEKLGIQKHFVAADKVLAGIAHG